MRKAMRFIFKMGKEIRITQKRQYRPDGSPFFPAVCSWLSITCRFSKSFFGKHCLRVESNMSGSSLKFCGCPSSALPPTRVRDKDYISLLVGPVGFGARISPIKSKLNNCACGKWNGRGRRHFLFPSCFPHETLFMFAQFVSTLQCNFVTKHDPNKMTFSFFRFILRIFIQRRCPTSDI